MAKSTKRKVRRRRLGWQSVVLILTCPVLLITAILRHSKIQKLPIKDRPIAVIDAGHGSFTSSGIIDVGASRHGLKESEIVLDIALQAQRYLESKGWIAVTTRDGPWTPFSLSQRSELANLVRADVFVSIHLNSHTSRRAHGLTVFHYHPEDKSLAEYLQNQLSQRLGLRNRGVATMPFAILAFSSVPAVLIELAFISNPIEAHRLNDPQFREKAARVLAEVLDEWYSQRSQHSPQ